MAGLPEALTLRGDGVLLRDWRAADAPVLEAVCGEWDVCRFTSVPWSYSADAAAAWIARNQRNRGAGKVLSLAIAEDGGGAVAGNVNLTRFSRDRRQAALGYWLVPAARGRNLATRAARLLADWGFGQLGLERVELAILPDNVASRRVAERLGATPEELRRRSHEAGGRWWDMAIYALGAQR
jgi:RimJ/RimL family protein N-acetyltransferase